jgi:hypothetical protein
MALYRFPRDRIEFVEIIQRLFGRERFGEEREVVNPAAEDGSVILARRKQSRIVRASSSSTTGGGT